MKIQLYEFIDLFRKDNRTNWLHDIQPYIIKVDYNEGRSYINFEDGEFWVSFTPEELDSNHLWMFNIGNIVTDGKDIMKVTNYPPLHPKAESFYDPNMVIEVGNKYQVIRINEVGEDIEVKNPYAYLHQSFNEKQIHKASQQEIDEILRNKNN